MSQQPTILLCIEDGFSFRSTIGCVAKETSQMTLIFKPDSLTISAKNVKETAIHEVDINCRCNSIQYIYNCRDMNGQLLKEYPLFQESDKICGALKDIVKKDSLVIYQFEGSPPSIRKFIPGIDLNTPDATFLTPIQSEFVKYELPHIYSSEPTAVISNDELWRLCKRFSANTCNTLTLTTQSSGIEVRGMRTNGVKTFEKIIPGPIKQTNNNELLLYFLGGASGDPIPETIAKEITTSITAETIKTLTKLHTVGHKEGIVWINLEEDKPLRIIVGIGMDNNKLYGRYTLWIKNEPPKTK